MFLYGAGGHAKVIIDILSGQHKIIEGIFDDNPNISELLNIPILKTDKIRGPLIISIGDNRRRKKISESVNVHFDTAIYKNAIISPTTLIGTGTVIMQGGIVQSCSEIGNHCIVNTGAKIDHDCLIGNFVHISPGSTLCGNITVGEGTWIGAGTTILPGIHIGKWSIIGAGSVVTKNIPDYVIAYGNSCNVIKKI